MLFSEGDADSPGRLMFRKVVRVAKNRLVAPRTINAPTTIAAIE